MVVDEKDTLKLSITTNVLLSKYQDKVILRNKKELDKLCRMDVREFLAEGIATKQAPFELAGRMARQGWDYIEYDSGKPGWRILAFNVSRYVSAKEVEDMLEAEE
jgi:hypothetical protein